MSNHRVPPHNLNAEQAVIGGLLLDNGAIDRMGDLKAEAFYRVENRDAYEQITRLLMAGKPADVITVSDALRQAGSDVGLPYLNEIATSVPSAANIGRYAEIVREKALMRGLLAASMRVGDLVAEGEQPAAQLLDAAQAEFGKLAETTVRREPVSIQEAMGRYLDALDSRFHGEGKNPGIKTGLDDLDEILNGGIRRGALVTIGARPGMGKSALGETIACNASEAGYSVFFWSGEMPESEVTERAVANWGRVPSTVLANAEKRMTQEHWGGVTRAVERSASAKLYVDDQPALSLLEIVTKARYVKRRHGLDLVVVDYLQLMAGGEEKRYQQIEAITKGLKTLAKTLNIAVIALSQFSREIEKRLNPRPKSSDFRDGGSIEQDSDILIGLYRDEQENPDSDLKGYAELHVMKNRQGKNGKINLAYLGEFMRFENFIGVVPEQQIRPPIRRKGFD